MFCVDQEHADQMRRALHNANADPTSEHPNYVVRIVSEEGEIGKRHLGDFADTEKDVPVIATTSQLLSTGVDLPTVENIVLFRPVGSLALINQMIGRGTRLFPDEDKLSFEIIDYSGATALFGDPEFFATYQPAARELLAHLLDKYALHGIDQLDDLGVLQAPPLSSLGSPAEIASRFGSTDELRVAVTRLGELLYAA